MISIFDYSFNPHAFILTAFISVFLIALWRAQKADQLNWIDMITRDGKTVSATKVLQLLGGIIGSWIIVQMTLNHELTWDIFAIYLGYVASIDGFSKMLIAKYSGGGERRSRREYDAYEPRESKRPNDSYEDRGAAKPRELD